LVHFYPLENLPHVYILLEPVRSFIQHSSTYCILQIAILAAFVLAETQDGLGKDSRAKLTRFLLEFSSVNETDDG